MVKNKLKYQVWINNALYCGRLNIVIYRVSDWSRWDLIVPINYIKKVAKRTNIPFYFSSNYYVFNKNEVIEVLDKQLRRG